MTIPRLRMVAGPNGSGKSTLLDYLRTHFSFPLGYCLNPDQIEEEIKRSRQLDFALWGIEVEEADLRSFVNKHPLTGRQMKKGLSVRSNCLYISPRLSKGYLPSVLCDFMRRQWLSEGQSFTFETVMSSVDKVDLLGYARTNGYRTYLYYVCTDSPLINQERVAVRVSQGGHAVPTKKIEPRYRRSLSLLSQAILNCNRAYLFDNSGQEHRLIAEFEQAKLKRVSEYLPTWFVENAMRCH